MNPEKIRSDLDSSIQELQKSIGVEPNSKINDVLDNLEKGKIDEAKDLLKSIKTIDDEKEEKEESEDSALEKSIDESVEYTNELYDDLQAEISNLQKSSESDDDVFVEGTQLIDGILKSLNVLMKQVQSLIKSNERINDLVKSNKGLAKVQIGVAEFLKSLDDKLGQLPTPKTQINNVQKEMLKSKLLAKQFGVNESGQPKIPARYEFLLNPEEIANRLEKACDDGKIEETVFTIEEQYGFKGQTLNKSQVEILANFTK